MSRAPDVAAIVLAGVGGDRLARSLESVRWASERVVVDPAGRVAGASLPEDVRSVHGVDDPVRSVRASWVLLVVEGEIASAALGERVHDAVRARRARAYRVPVDVWGLGARLRRRGAPVRLAERAGAAIAVGFGALPVLQGAHTRGPRLGASLIAVQAASLEEALRALDADAAAAAALLGARAVRPRPYHLVAPPLAAGLAVLTAGGGARVRWGRWSLAVLGAYRALLTYAKLWELRRAAGLVAS